MTTVLKVIKGTDSPLKVAGRLILEREIKEQIKTPSMREDADKLKDYISWINSSQLNNQFTENELAEEIAKHLGENSSLNNIYDKNSNLITDEVTRYLMSENTYITNGNSIYKYNTKYYQCIDNSDIKAEIRALAINKKNVNKANVEAVSWGLTTEKELLQECTPISSYIGFENGVYSVKENQLVPFDKDIKIFSIQNFDYKENLSIEGTNFEKLLLTSLGAEFIPLIQEMIGYSLDPNAKRVHKFFLMVGVGRNGKGILLNIIDALHPKEAKSHLSMCDYDTRFINSSLEGKRVNIQFDDATQRLENIGNFKKVVAGEEITVEEKGKDAYNITPNSVYIGATNTIPSIQEKSNAFINRAIIIPFEETFGTAEEVARGEKTQLGDKDLLDKCLEELPIITSWAIEGLKRLINNGYQFSIPKKCIDAIKEADHDQNTAKKWSSEAVIGDNVHPSQAPNMTKLYKHYIAWCRDEELGTPMLQKAFKQVVKHELRQYSKEYNNKTVYLVTLSLLENTFNY